MSEEATPAGKNCYYLHFQAAQCRSQLQGNQVADKSICSSLSTQYETIETAKSYSGDNHHLVATFGIFELDILDRIH